MTKSIALRIQYVSAPAGSGKTHQLQRLAAKLVSSENRKVLIAQPTKQLIAQTAEAIRQANPNINVHTIFSLGDGSAVLPRIEQHMREADKSVGQVLLITHEALKRLPNAYRVHWVSIGVQTGPLIGAQKGPPVRMAER